MVLSVQHLYFLQHCSNSNYHELFRRPHSILACPTKRLHCPHIPCTTVKDGFKNWPEFLNCICNSFWVVYIPKNICKSINMNS
nr:hypothetical protein Iba_chr03cCG9050 [Ipomoea batatas]